MANRTIEMYKIRQLIRLSLEGRGSKYISASIGISRNTVKKYLALLRGSGYDGTQLSAMGDDTLLNEAKGIGVKYFLMKPFKPDALKEKLNEVFA